MSVVVPRAVSGIVIQGNSNTEVWDASLWAGILRGRAKYASSANDVLSFALLKRNFLFRLTGAYYGQGYLTYSC